MGRGRRTARFITIGALRRALSWGLCGVVWLGRWWARRIGRRRICCSGAWQILLLLTRRLAICLCVANRRKRLAICAVHWRRLPNAAPYRVRRHKGLCLGRDGGKDAVLVESHAIRTAAVFSSLES